LVEGQPITESAKITRKTPGTAVECRFGKTPKFYGGAIEAARADGTYAVLYDDGDREDGVVRRRIRLAGQTQPQNLEIGTLVDARSDSRKVLPGLIADARTDTIVLDGETHATTLYAVQFDSGELCEHMERHFIFAEHVDAEPEPAAEPAAEEPVEEPAEEPEVLHRVDLRIPRRASRSRQSIRPTLSRIGQDTGSHIIKDPSTSVEKPRNLPRQHSAHSGQRVGRQAAGRDPRPLGAPRLRPRGRAGASRAGGR